MLTSRHLGLHVVGFVDDDPQKQRLSIHNVPVLGKRTDVPALVKNHAIDQIVIAIPSAPGRDVREIVQICEGAGIMPRTVPGIYELIEGSVSLTHLRPIEIEDLLRRDPVQTDSAAVRELLHGKRVLVTGGGGSIGSELCRQILRARPARLILLGHGENSVFEIQNELLRECRKQQLPPETIHGIIADVRFGERILTIFRQLRPEIIFHAAAHKHVPLMEENPAEAITNNVLGTRNILAAARAVGVQRFVMISTDKAVNPTSIMGASKRTAELLVHEMALATGKPYMAVRFGNVLGSRGSVVLTFKQQIAAGGPVTVTDPEMKRFFMTIPEAVQLVLQAGVLGHGGEVFLLDMGEPVKIVDLARDLIELSGLEVGRDIDIVFSGLRPGEKLFEELFIPGEEYRRTEHQKIFIAANASSFVPADLEESIALLAHAADSNDRDLIVRAGTHSRV
jgi:FlaA1/EpsC-like NDP-sugar epimerase